MCLWNRTTELSHRNLELADHATTALHSDLTASVKYNRLTYSVDIDTGALVFVGDEMLAERLLERVTNAQQADHLQLTFCPQLFISFSPTAPCN